MTQNQIPLAVEFLQDGRQPAQAVAGWIAAFLDGAVSSLDMSIYDFRLEPAPARILLDAVRRARGRGVAVRLLFNQDHARRRVDPPPPAVDWDLVRALDVPFYPISGVPNLMHHKYVVRDAAGANGAVLTGSANWTTDSWTREENALVVVRSPEIAAAYAENFEELWTTHEVAGSGLVSAGWATLFADGERVLVRPHFCPGGAGELVSEITAQLASASRIRLCSPVLTEPAILHAVATALADGRSDVRGVYDSTQVAEVRAQWAAEPGRASEMEDLEVVTRSDRFGAKRSIPYSSGGPHDFMHAKLLVADSTVFIGSYNLSRSGIENAENVLEIESARLAAACAQFVDEVAERYPHAGVAPAAP